MNDRLSARTARSPPNLPRWKKLYSARLNAESSTIASCESLFHLAMEIDLISIFCVPNAKLIVSTLR